MLGMVFIDAIRRVRQGRIVARGTARPRLDALVQQGKGRQGGHPSVEALARGNVRRVKIQRQLGGDTVVPQGVRIFRQLQSSLLLDEQVSNQSRAAVKG